MQPALVEVRQGRDADEVASAIQRARDVDPGAVADAITARYQYLAENGHGRDAGAYIRTALIQGLRGLARHSDLDLVEDITYVRETMPRSAIDVAVNLRAAAMLIVADLDPALGMLHAARMLGDIGTSEMSGQPAVTAVQLLRAHDQLLPIYVFLEGRHAVAGEVTGECLAAMATAPGRIVHGLVERYRDDTNDAARLGLYDMLLARPEDGAANAEISEYIRTGTPDPVYSYVVTTVVASRRMELVDAIREAHRGATGLRLRRLNEALELLPRT